MRYFGLLTLSLTLWQAAIAPTVAAQTVPTTRDTISLRFDWPAGLTAIVARSDMRITARDDFADTTGGSSRYRMTVSEHPDGRLIDFSQFEILDLDDFRSGYQPAMTFAKVRDGLVPSFIASPAGGLVGLADYPALRSTADQLLAPHLDSLPDLPIGGAALVGRLLSEDVYTARIADEWAATVQLWAGEAFEVGATYGFETQERPPIVADTVVTHQNDLGVTARTPCHPRDADTSCVALWMTSSPTPEAMAALTSRITKAMNADSLAAARVDSLAIRNEILVVAEPDGLIPHQIEITRHTYTRARDGTGAPEANTHASVLRLAYVYGVPGTATAGVPLDSAVAVFLQNRVEQSVPLFRNAVSAEPSNPHGYAWLGEALRRTGDLEGAVTNARRALELAPCHAFAHTVLASAYNPQYKAHEAAHADSVWSHLTEAIECDPDDGNAWLSLLFEAVQRGETQWEGSAARALVETGFLADPTLAYTRSALRALPGNAVFLTAGDLDTYPAIALQVAEGVRPDVAVVNLSMLNLPWYARTLRDRHGVALALDDAGLDAFSPIPNPDGQPLTLADTIIRSWRTAAANGSLGRPLAMAITAGDTTRFPGPGRFASGGFYYLVHPADGMRMVNPGFVGRGLDSLGIDQLQGRGVSSQDRSPVRVAMTAPPLTMAGYAGVIYANAVEPAALWTLSPEDHTRMANVVTGFEAIAHQWRPPFYDDLIATYSRLWIGLSATAADPLMAADYAGQAIRLRTDLGDARHLFGVALLRNGQGQDAVDHLYGAYDDPKPLASLIALAESLRMSNDPQGAALWSDSAVTSITPQKMSDEAFAWSTWYVGLFPEQSGDNAIRQPIPIIDPDHKTALAHFGRAIDFAILGQRATADASFAQATTLGDAQVVQCIVQNRIGAALGNLELTPDVRAWLIARQTSLDQADCVVSAP